MKVSVTPFCHHGDGLRSSGAPFEGSTLLVTPTQVEVDGIVVLRKVPPSRIDKDPHRWAADINRWTDFDAQVYSDLPAPRRKAR